MISFHSLAEDIGAKLREAEEIAKNQNNGDMLTPLKELHVLLQIGRRHLVECLPNNPDSDMTANSDCAVNPSQIPVRISDPGELKGLMTEFRDHFIDINPNEWMSCSDNFFLRDLADNRALFESASFGVLDGHYFFRDRGRLAMQAARNFLREIFRLSPLTEVIRGLVPVENLAAKWITRQLGFTSYGEMDTIYGPVELFILTRNEWELKYG